MHSGWTKLANCLAGTATTTSTASLDAIFKQVGVVCVARSRVQICLGVVLWTLIFVLDKEPDRCAKSDTLFDSGLDVDQIFFITLETYAMSTRCDQGQEKQRTGVVRLL